MTIAVFGGNGKMGKRVIALANSRNINCISIEQYSNIDNVICDGIIDFSNGNAIPNIVTVATNNNCPVVSGTTALTQQQQSMLQQLSHKVPVIQKNNFSTGINAIITVLPILTDLMPNYYYDMIDIHHQDKVDSPSGTALSLQNILNANKKVVKNIATIRNGNHYGTHSIIISNPQESITITHSALSRDCFAQGALDTLLQLMQ